MTTQNPAHSDREHVTSALRASEHCSTFGRLVPVLYWNEKQAASPFPAYKQQKSWPSTLIATAHARDYYAVDLGSGYWPRCCRSEPGIRVPSLRGARGHDAAPRRGCRPTTTSTQGGGACCYLALSRPDLATSCYPAKVQDLQQQTVKSIRLMAFGCIKHRLGLFAYIDERRNDCVCRTMLVP